MSNEVEDGGVPPMRASARTRLIRAALVFGLVAALLLVLVGYVWLKPSRIGEVAIGGPFTLVNAAGQEVTDRDFRGHYLLVYFGYTFCPDVCPTTLNTMAAAMALLGPKGDRVQSLFITVDPKRDTPPVIGPYAAAFSPRIVGLTGAGEQIAAVEKEYRVYAAEHRTGSGPNDYVMDHSSVIYLVGTDGRFIAPINADASSAEMAKVIAGYL